MKHKKIESILDEIDSFMPDTDKHKLVEVRGDNVIRSTINLLEDIKRNFSEDEYNQLKMKILNAIKSEDPSKFANKIRTIGKQNESKRFR